MKKFGEKNIEPPHVVKSILTGYSFVYVRDVLTKIDYAKKICKKRNNTNTLIIENTFRIFNFRWVPPFPERTALAAIIGREFAHGIWNAVMCTTLWTSWKTWREQMQLAIYGLKYIALKSSSGDFQYFEKADPFKIFATR